MKKLPFRTKPTKSVEARNLKKKTFRVSLRLKISYPLRQQVALGVLNDNLIFSFNTNISFLCDFILPSFRGTKRRGILKRIHWGKINLKISHAIG